MAKQSSTSKRSSRKKITNTSDIVKKSAMYEKDLNVLEDETLRKVNKSISALEVALAGWEASKDKPEYLRSKYQKYERFHKELAMWTKKILHARKLKRPVDERVELLRDFVKICSSYSRS
ncbi:hypothetical protein KKE92_00450 [Candidatus Micrarchaeota archaeon]|nr:hypothetical protein [Candidatus Micrarchaeota archaeon]